MKEQLKSRKLLFAMTLLVISIVFVYLDKANFVDWANFIQWVFGIYAAGNVGEHISTKSSKKGILNG